jgi:hypothetical protein
MDLINRGSSLLLASMSQLGSVLSVFRAVVIGSDFNVLSNVYLSASIAVNGGTCLGGDLSTSKNLVIDRTVSVRRNFELSSTFSMRSFVHLGSAMSAEKDTRTIGQSAECTRLHLSRTLAVLGRLGSGISILGRIRLDGGLSLTGFHQYGRELLCAFRRLYRFKRFDSQLRTDGFPCVNKG